MNIHTIMMESTLRIRGDGSTGTGFVVGKPDPEQDGRYYFILVTAHHVLANVKGDSVLLTLREAMDEAGETWQRIEYPIQIRASGKDLWTKHSKVDLAAMVVALPTKTVRSLIPAPLLLTDEKIRELEIGPGTELLCLGYPFGVEANPEGFPILRSGKVASYPLLPTASTKSFLFDFSVFPGCSGGPVYYYEKNPMYGGTVHLGAIQGIMGVATRERSIAQRMDQLYERKETITPLALGEVIHARFVEEMVRDVSVPSDKVESQ